MLLTSGSLKSHSSAGLTKGAMKPPLACTHTYNTSHNQAMALGKRTGHAIVRHLHSKDTSEQLPLS